MPLLPASGPRLKCDGCGFEVSNPIENNSNRSMWEKDITTWARAFGWELKYESYSDPRDPREAPTKTLKLVRCYGCKVKQQVSQYMDRDR